MKEEQKPIVTKKQDLLYSTRCSDVFRAEQDQGVFLNWKLKYPIDDNLLIDLESRLKKINSISNLEIVDLKVSNPPSALVKFSNLTPVIGSSWIPIELEDNFISILGIVKKLHDLDVVIGDITDNSFMFNDENKIVLGSLLGDYDFAAKQTALLPPQECLNYLAPERGSSAKTNKLTDIYGLGVYAYKLFTAQYPRSGAKPSSIRSDVPIWLDLVASKCLEEDPKNRFPQVDEILSLIKHTVNTGKLPEAKQDIKKTEHVSKKDFLILPTKENKAEQDFEEKELSSQKSQQVSAEKPPSQQISSAKNEVSEDVLVKKNGLKKIFLWLFSVLMGLAVASFLFLSISADSKKEQTDIEVNNPIALVAEYASDESKDLILSLLKTTDLEKRKQILEKINEIDPEISKDLRSVIITSGKELDLSRHIKQLIINDLRKQNLKVTSGLLEDWLSISENVNPISNLVLRALEGSRPTQSRIDLLKKASKKDQISALRFAGALAIDIDSGDYLFGLKEILQALSSEDNFDNLGLGATLLSHSAFNIFLGKDMTSAVKRFSNEDLKWSLLKSAESNSPLLKDIAIELMSRDILSPSQMIFMGVLINPEKNTRAFSREIALATLDKLQSSDIYNLAKWDSLNSEKMLIAISAFSKDKKIVRESFELLAAKSIQNKTAETFVNWVKDGFWDYRSKLAKPVAVLSSSDSANEQEINQAFDSLMPFVKGGLFNAVSSTGDYYLIKNALGRMGELLADSELLFLLQNKNPEIRIEAVRSLKGRNELKVLQGILRGYDNEKEPKVIKAYHQYHWVTKDRVKKGF